MPPSSNPSKPLEKESKGVTHPAKTLMAQIFNDEYGDFHWSVIVLTSLFIVALTIGSHFPEKIPFDLAKWSFVLLGASFTLHFFKIYHSKDKPSLIEFLESLLLVTISIGVLIVFLILFACLIYTFCCLLAVSIAIGTPFAIGYAVIKISSIVCLWMWNKIRKIKAKVMSLLSELRKFYNEIRIKFLQISNQLLSISFRHKKILIFSFILLLSSECIPRSQFPWPIRLLLVIFAAIGLTGIFYILIEILPPLIQCITNFLNKRNPSILQYEKRNRAIEINKYGELNAIANRLSELANKFASDVDAFTHKEIKNSIPYISVYAEIKELFRSAKKILSADISILKKA